MNALITAPSLWALLPLVLYIIFLFTEKADVVLVTGFCVVLGFGLLGKTPAEAGKALTVALGGNMGIIALIIMLGAGLGRVMSNSGIAQAVVFYICRIVGINTKGRALVSITICSVLICGLLGTLAGGIAILAPIVIPIAATVGLAPATVGAIMLIAGSTGLIWGPFTPPTVATLACTGLTYSQLMLWAALPFGVVGLALAFLCAHIIQKRKEGIEVYEGDYGTLPTEVDALTKRKLIAFLVAFLALVVYAIVTHQGINYSILVMLILPLVITAFGDRNFDKMIKDFTAGMGTQAKMFLLFILLGTMLNLITEGGGFDALGEVLSGVLNAGGRLGVMFGATVLGAFGISGGAAAEIYLLTEMFENSIQVTNLPMEMWALVLIAASRITSNLFPSANMLGVLGLARTSDTKSAMFMGWVTSIGNLIFMIIFALICDKMIF